MNSRKPYRYWTYDKCKEVVNGYAYLSDLVRENGSVINSIRRNGWLDLLSNLKRKKRTPPEKWTYNKCKEVSLKYDNKYKFRNENKNMYSAMCSKGWLFMLSHMKIVGNLHKRLIYVYEFSDNFCYIGLTCDIKRRNNEHINYNKRNSSVKEHISKTGITPKLIIKSDYIDVNDAILLEEKVLHSYLSKGYKILNKTKTGSIGSNNILHTKESCKKEALKYSRLKDFRKKSRNIYLISCKRGWIDDISKHMIRERYKSSYWNDKQLCEIESKKYMNRKEFKLNNWTAWNYSKTNGWLDDFFPPKNK